MNKLVLLFTASLLIVSFSFGQHHSSHHQELVPGVDRCGHDHVIQEMSQEDPDFLNRRMQSKQNVKDWIDHQQQHQSSRAVVTIPVVVHVIYRTTAQNISAAQVQTQIDVLNEDFRRLNADAANTPSVFQGVAADTEIEFCLANSDPNGDLTDGITRTQTTTNNIGSTNAYYRTSQGGQDIWNRNRYLNIWVCELSAGLLGFATPPGANAQRDGVVVSVDYFGTIGTATAPFNRGRTATHEVGHWLNLDHMWGGGCGIDDGVNDTPDSDAPYYGCPSFPQTTCGTEDMFMNYMDYVNDNCMNMFTEDQAQIMVATLNTSRSSILSSNGCSFGCNIIELSYNSTYCGESTGEVTAAATGGVAPYTFQWGPATGNQNTATITGLSPGNYSVTVTDADGCTRTGTASFVGNGTLLQGQVVTANSIGANCNGSAAAVATGGTPPLTYAWSNGSGILNAFNLCAGQVTVTITDAANCELIINETIVAEAPVGLNEWSAESLFLFPNPTHDAITLGGLPAQGAQIAVFDLRGSLLNELSVTGQSNLQLPLAAYGKGTFLVQVRTADQTVFRRVVVQ
ncbi:MAG: M43 family zinc metalloprotease [Salibacteraceae bacterium]